MLTWTIGRDIIKMFKEIEQSEVNKMAFNYQKLLGRITEKMGSQAEFARHMGLSERTISLKLNGKVPFKQNEIVKASSLLGIDNSDIAVYFFTVNVQ